jgi:hypothetical protein
VTPSNPINMGTTLVGTPISFALQISNTGAGTLNVNSGAPFITGTNAIDFTVTPALPLNIIPGTPQFLTIQCNPSGAGLRTATLNLTTNDPARLTVFYTLNCVGTVEARYSSIPAPNTLVNVGTANVGGLPATTNISIREVGNAQLVVNAPMGGALTGCSNPCDFSLTTALPLVINDGSPALQLNIQCIPIAAGLRTATLTLTTNDPTQATVTYTLNCTGVAVNNPGYNSSPAPGSTLNMTAPVGAGVTVTILVTEIGSATLNVTAPAAGLITGTNAADFAVVTGAPPFSIADGGGPQTVTVRCIPGAVGQRLAVLTFNTNDPTLTAVVYSLSCVGTSVTDANATATPIGGVAPTPTITIPQSPTPTPLGPPVGQVIEVRGLAIRTGPYLGATIIGVLRPGTTYSIVGQSQDEGIYTWFYITVGRISGWVSGRFFQTSGNMAIVPTMTSIFDQIDNAPDTGVIAVANSIIDMRRRPSGRTQIVNTIPLGATVQVLGRTMQGGLFWLHVRYNGIVGWIPAAPVDVIGSIAAVPIR